MHPDVAKAAVAATRSIRLPDVSVVEDLAPFMRITPEAVCALIRSGQIPGRKVGRRWLVDRGLFLQSLVTFPPLRVFRPGDGDAE